MTQIKKGDIVTPNLNYTGHSLKHGQHYKVYKVSPGEDYDYVYLDTKSTQYPISRRWLNFSNCSSLKFDGVDSIKKSDYPLTPDESFKPKPMAPIRRSEIIKLLCYMYKEGWNTNQFGAPYVPTETAEALFQKYLNGDLELK